MQFSRQKIDWKKKPVVKDILDANQVPDGLTAKQLHRRAAMIAEAKEAANNIPESGQAIHLLLTGRYDLMHLVAVMLEKIGKPCLHLSLATLSFNSRNTVEILRLIDCGTVKRCTVLCSKFFKQHNPGEYKQLKDGLAERGEQHTLAYTRCHAKIVVMDFGPADKMVIEGSANLRGNGNIEQATIINDLEIAGWHSTWIDEFTANGKKEEEAWRGQADRSAEAEKD